MNKLVILFFAMAFVSCASTKQYVSFTHDKPLEKGKGRVYVIKPCFAGSAVKVSIFCDDILIGNATNGSYLCWDLTEGEHTIGNTQFAHAGATLGAGKAEDVVRINVKDGKSYFIKISPKYMGGMDFNILTTKEGEQAIKGRKKPTLNYVD